MVVYLTNVEENKESYRDIEGNFDWGILASI